MLIPRFGAQHLAANPGSRRTQSRWIGSEPSGLWTSRRPDIPNAPISENPKPRSPKTPNPKLNPIKPKATPKL